MDDQSGQGPNQNLLLPLCKNDDGIELGVKKRWHYISDGTVVELKKQLRLAGPLVLVSLLQYSLQTISVMFVGHLGEVYLSAASMATSFAGVTGFSLMVTSFSSMAYFKKLYYDLSCFLITRKY